MTRNILATCPRVTRFRIDWNDAADGQPGDDHVAVSDNTENLPPPFHTESESNQMQLGIGGDSLLRDSSNSNQGLGFGGLTGALPNGNAAAADKVVLNGSTTDGRNMDVVGGGGDFPQRNPSGTSDSNEPAAMEM